MTESMNISSSTYASELIPLPWDTPLEQWPDDLIEALPRGISRHVVRFIGLQRGIVAVKEIGVRVAHHEFRMLRELQRLGAPSVTPVAVITGRVPTEEEDGELTAALVTEHLEFSLPYREIFSQVIQMDVAGKLMQSLAVLMVRLHLLNFYWGDVSLSNTLFRRDADTFSAYLVDAETGEIQPTLSRSRRLHDLEIARVNIIGEMMDLQGGGIMDADVDVIALGNQLERNYLELWDELTAEQSVDESEYWRVSERINRLGELGFDVGELSVVKDSTRRKVNIRPAVVDAGHNHRQLLRLTGLEVEEGQARRLLNSIRAYAAVSPSPQGYGRNAEDLSAVAYRWMVEEYEPTIAAIPDELKGKLEPAQIFHEILDHKWFLSEAAQDYVGLREAAESYFGTVLPHHRDEARLFGPGTP